MRGISIVIPVLRDDAALRRLIQTLGSLDVAEIIIADAENKSKTRPISDLTKSRNVKWITAPKGRGAQIAEGIATATQPLVWVLHADSQPARGSAAEIRRLLRDPWTSLACFPLTFRHRSKSLKLFAAISRAETALTTFGDQGFAFRREDYLRLDIDLAKFPLLEDIALRAALKRLGKVRKSKLKLSTSARRFERLGVWKTQYRNAGILYSYWRGASPTALYARYYELTRQTTPTSPPSWLVRQVSTPVRAEVQKTASDYPAASRPFPLPQL